MGTGPERIALRMVVFVAILIALNGVFWLLGVHEHIDIMGSIVLTLVVTGVLYAVYAMQGKR
jgi:cellobiose-specific phosphotransferase system component IIC